MEKNVDYRIKPGCAKQQKYIEIKLPGCKVFLTPAEVNRLLLLDPELWETAIRRGKAVLRARAAQERNGKTPVRCRGEPF